VFIDGNPLGRLAPPSWKAQSTALVGTNTNGSEPDAETLSPDVVDESDGLGKAT